MDNSLRNASLRRNAHKGKKALDSAMMKPGNTDGAWLLRGGVQVEVVIFGHRNQGGDLRPRAGGSG